MDFSLIISFLMMSVLMGQCIGTMEILSQLNPSLPVGGESLTQMVGAHLSEDHSQMWLAGTRSHATDAPADSPLMAGERHSQGAVVRFERELLGASEDQGWSWTPSASWLSPDSFVIPEQSFMSIVVREASTEFSSISFFEAAPRGHPLAALGNGTALVCTETRLFLLDLGSLEPVRSSSPGLHLAALDQGAQYVPGLSSAAVDWEGNRVYVFRHTGSVAQIYELELDTLAVLQANLPLGLPVPVTAGRFELRLAGDHLLFLDGKSLEVKTAPVANLSDPWSGSRPFDGLLNAIAVASAPSDTDMFLTLDYGFVVRSSHQFAAGTDKDISYNDDPNQGVTAGGCTALQASVDGALLFQYCPRRLTRMAGGSLAALEHAELPDVFGPGETGPRNIVIDERRQIALVLGWSSAVVLEMSTAACGRHDSCSACIEDPACGWCSDTQSCTLPAFCAGGAGYHNRDQCSDLQSLSPSLGSAGGNTLVTVSLNMPFTPPNATCHFDSMDGDERRSSPASPGAGAGQVVCASPRRSLNAVGTSSVQVSLTFLNESLTQNPLVFTYYDCAPFATCALCHDEEARPECGWCLSSGLCVGLGSCAASDERVPPESGGPTAANELLCPRLGLPSPSSSPTDGGVEVLVGLSRGVMTQSTSLECVFGSLPPVSARSLSNGTVACSAPRAPDAGSFPVALVYANSRRSYADNDGPFRYNDCGLARDCSACALEATPGCGWCLASGTCGRLGTGACVTDEFWVASSGSDAACPRASSVSPARVTTDGGQRLTVTGERFFDAPGNWTCSFSGAEQRTPATVSSSSELLCETPRRLSGTALVQPFFSDSAYGHPSAGASIEFVDCSAARDCSSCVAKSDDGCGWCATSRRCVGRSSCADIDAAWSSERCPAIGSLQPTFGSVSGGEVIDIEGSFFVENSGLMCRFGNLAPVNVTFVTEELVQCTAPPGTVGDQLSFALVFEDGTTFASTDQRFTILEEQLPLPPIAIVGIAGGLVFCLLLAIITACCFMRKSRKVIKQVRAAELKYMPPRLTPALQSSVAFAGIDVKSTSLGGKRPKNSKEVIRLLVEEPSIAAAMAARASSSEVDSLSKALVILHESQSSAVRLINYFVSSEVAQTEQRSQLFRSNSMATKMFQIFSKMRGLNYIHGALGEAVNEAASGEPSTAARAEDRSLALLVLARRALSAILDAPESVPAEFQSIFATVRLEITRKFPITVDSLTDVVYETLKSQLLESKQTIDQQIRNYNKIDDIETDLSRSLGDGRSVSATAAMEQQYVAPVHLKPKMAELDAFVSSLVQNVEQLSAQMSSVSQASSDMLAALDSSTGESRALLDKQANHQLSIAVGGFFFLRFICPAIMTPESFGLVAQPPSRDQRKPLILLAKVFQNLSNGVSFSADDRDTAKLNELIDGHLEHLNKFFRAVSDASPDNESQPCKIPDDIKTWATAYVTEFVARNVDKISSELLQMQEPEAEAKLKQLCSSGMMTTMGKMSTQKEGRKKRHSGQFKAK